MLVPYLGLLLVPPTWAEIARGVNGNQGGAHNLVDFLHPFFDPADGGKYSGALVDIIGRRGVDAVAV